MLSFLIPNKKNNYKPYLLRNSALLVYTALLLFVNTFSGLIGISEVHASSITSTNIISLTNIERGKYGLNKLKNNSKLASAALAKANNMLKEQYWNHFGPNGETPWQFIKAAGYTYVYAGENLAKGFKSSEGVVEAWMASPTHRDNLLSGNYTEIGVAVVSGKLLGENTTLVVQMFANPTDVVRPSPVITKPSVQTQKGETMSIKITSPKNGTILNDANVDIKGEVKNPDGKYTVKVSDGKIPLGGFESNGQSWEWDKQSDWSEGKHTVTATLENVKGVSSNTTFTVDTTPPTLNTFETIIGGFTWDIKGEIDDKKAIINIVSGDMNRSIQTNSDGKFSLTVESSEISDKVSLVMSDSLGNEAIVDISDYFKTREKGNVLGSVMNVVNSLGQRDTINIIFLGFILILLLIEVYAYWRKGILAKHGGSLFTLGFWWLLLLVGVLNGFSGSIN